MIDKNKIARKPRNVKMRIFRNQVRANLGLMQSANGSLADKIGAMLRHNRNSEPIPFDGSSPDDSGDESSAAARLGLGPEA